MTSETFKNSDSGPISIAAGNRNRSTLPGNSAFSSYMLQGWAEPESRPVKLAAAAPYAAQRRQRIREAFPDQILIFDAGQPPIRANDTEYRFRPDSTFTYLSGWGAETVFGAKLVLHPAVVGNQATLFFAPGAGRDSDEFYANPTVGEFWLGPRPQLHTVQQQLGMPCLPLKDLDGFLNSISAGAAGEPVRYPQDLAAGQTKKAAAELLAQTISELRLIKDPWEISEMRAAVAATVRGFNDVVKSLEDNLEKERGERLVEGVFYTRARSDGYELGYSTIAASGSHSCVLHWSDNSGALRRGELLLLDAGVEMPSLYAADITRTLPLGGCFSPIQRQIYDAVLDAADAAFAAARPGAYFRELHEAAIARIAEHTASWGLLPVSAAESLLSEHQYHRRFMVHGTGHHLGLDVHDCSRARREQYYDGRLREGMVFTIEPGLYFQENDMSVPPEFRGIGVRIEDDVLITATGAENLSAALPRTAAAVEAWVNEFKGTEG